MQPDYFVNHRRASRFPWSIYHRPLEGHLRRFFEQVASNAPAPRVLAIGGGFLHELPDVPRSVRLTVVDVDERVIEHVSRIGDPRIEMSVAIRDPAELAALGPFDGAYAKEVIEHLIDPEHQAAIWARTLRPGAPLWLSTPNYGDPWLPLVESTVLELLGRVSGYSRREMHPTRFDRARLYGLLTGLGLDGVRVERTPFRLALVGTGTVARRSS